MHIKVSFMDVLHAFLVCVAEIQRRVHSQCILSNEIPHVAITVNTCLDAKNSGNKLHGH